MIQLNSDGTTLNRPDIEETDVPAQWAAMKADSSIDCFLTQQQYASHYKVWDENDNAWHYHWDRPEIYQQNLINS